MMKLPAADFWPEHIKFTNKLREHLRIRILEQAADFAFIHIFYFVISFLIVLYSLGRASGLALIFFPVNLCVVSRSSMYMIKKSALFILFFNIENKTIE